MALRFQQKETEYRKKLLVFLPVSLFLIWLLFVTSDVVPYKQLQERLGWEGPIELLPEITIVPDEDPFEETQENTPLQTLSAMDVTVIDEQADAPGGALQEIPPVEPNEVVTPELTEMEIRHYPAHTEVPYTDDYIILHMVQPEYPPAELTAGVEGDVTVELLINADGFVENAWVLAVLGPHSFEESALEAVRQFRFKPPVMDGEPQPMWIRFQIKFRLFG